MSTVTLLQHDPAVPLDRTVDPLATVAPVPDIMNTTTMDPRTACYYGYGCNDLAKLIGLLTGIFLCVLFYLVVYMLWRCFCTPHKKFYLRKVAPDQQRLVEEQHPHELPEASPIRTRDFPTFITTKHNSASNQGVNGSYAGDTSSSSNTNEHVHSTTFFANDPKM
ncbi:unnamed protein product, partial [Mesorhabditis spiculigera]